MDADRRPGRPSRCPAPIRARYPMCIRCTVQKEKGSAPDLQCLARCQDMATAEKSLPDARLVP